MKKYELVEKRWLKRVLKIPGTDNTFSYSGRGIGNEQCVIDEEIYTADSESVWFIPEFNIEHSGSEYNVQVRIWPWPWLSLRSLQIYKDGELVYQEGKNPYKISEITEPLHLVIWMALTFGPFIIMAKML